MAAGLVGLGLGVVGTVAFGPTPYRVEQLPVATRPVVDLAGLGDIRLTMGPGWSIRDLAEALAAAAGLRVTLREDLLTRAKMDPDSPIQVGLDSVPFREIVRVVAEEPGMSGQELGVRVSDGVVEVATQRYFDRLERATVMYDISAYVRMRQPELPNRSVDEIVHDAADAIQELVEFESWYENGGDLASLRALGSRLIIDAPKRFHPAIKAVLDSLPMFEGVPSAPEPRRGWSGRYHDSCG